MKNKSESKDVLHEFFREGEMHVLNPSRVEREGDQGLSFETPKSEKVTLTKPVPAAEEEVRDFWRKLRGFFRTGNPEVLAKFQLTDDHIPATLAPFKEQNFTHESFPFWIAEEGDNFPASALTPWLEDCWKQSSASSKILSDQIARLGQMMTQKVDLTGAVTHASPLAIESLEALKDILDVKGEEGAEFEQGILSLKQALPDHGVLIPYSPIAPFQIINQLLENRRKQQRQKLLDRIGPLMSGLTDMINVEKLKSPEATTPEKLQDSLGFADEFVSFDKLSSLIPHDTENHMPEERLARLEKVVSILRSVPEMLLQHNASIVLSQKAANTLPHDWRSVFPNGEIVSPADDAIEDTVIERFNQLTRSCVQAIVAMRIAELEIADQYVAAIHGDYFAHFTWRALSSDEWAYCTPVILIAEDGFVYKELNAFSQLLASNRPIMYLCIRSLQTARPSSTDEVDFRRELGALALAHRNTFVLQTSAISPEMIYTGVQRGLEHPTPFLFHLLTLWRDEAESHISFLRTSAAVEGREFPGFVFDSVGSSRWGNRFDIGTNPGTEADWPLHQIEALTEGEESNTLSLPFTYADFSSLQASFRNRFLLVPSEYWNENLVPISAYLQLTEEDASTKIPFIWMVDGSRHLCKIAVAWQIVALCRERLDFWNFLQENAGVHSYHVEKASEQLRQKMQEERKQELNDMQSKHAEEMEKVRVDSARTSMEKLAGMLLDIDDMAFLTDGIAQDNTTVDRSVTEITDQITHLEPDPAKEHIEESEPTPGSASMEAYIDTALCTSCNECTDLNNRIFSYDGNKQAFIQDASAGPFSDMVKAAELCPVHIIHPGTPLNPNEDNLEEWTKRAEPFN